MLEKRSTLKKDPRRRPKNSQVAKNQAIVTFCMIARKKKHDSKTNFFKKNLQNVTL